MDRTWALTEKGKELVAVIMASGVESQEFALRIAETMVAPEELYKDLDHD